MKRNLLFVVLLGTASALPACATPLTYSAEPIEAKVIDAETKQPLEGVIVTANWELRGGPSPGGSTAVGQLMVMETVTDKNGRFHFPAWGPKLRPPLTELHNHDPQLLLFKSGYRYAELANEPRYMYQPETILEPVRRSDWNGKMIEMKPFRGSLEEWARHLGFLMTSLRFVEENCNWKKTPRIILALDPEKERLRKSGIIRTFYSVSYLPTNEKVCGSPQEFFRSYQP